MSIFNTGRYVTTAMAEKAAQECSKMACDTAAGIQVARVLSMSLLTIDTVMELAETLLLSDPQHERWARAEARLRSGHLPPGWWWRSHEDYWQMIEGTNWNAATMALFRVGKVKP